MQFFFEQGSSAFQMTVAKTMDVIARLPSCDGQAADVVMTIGATRHRKKNRKSTITRSGFKQKIILSDGKERGTFF